MACSRTILLLVGALVSCADETQEPAPVDDGDAIACPPAEVEVVSSPQSFEIFYRGCDCTERFATDGTCRQTSAGDSSFCTGCETPPPQLREAWVRSAAGETRFDMSGLLDDGGRVVVPRAPHGAGAVTIGFAGCWGDGELTNIGASDALREPTCADAFAPTSCVVDDAAEMAHVCSQSESGTRTCCERFNGSIDVASVDGAGDVFISAVHDDGIATIGGLSVHLWRSATARIDARPPCVPAAIDLVAEPTSFAMYLRDCGCTEQFATNGGCIDSSGGDSEGCECERVPSLTELAIDGTSFPLAGLIDDGGVARIARDGSDSVTIGVAGCWGSAERVVPVGVATAPECIDDVAPTTCAVDDAADLSHVCRDADIYGSSCCEEGVGVVDVPAPDGARVTISSVHEDGVETLGNVTIHLWRSATTFLSVPP